MFWTLVIALLLLIAVLMFTIGPSILTFDRGREYEWHVGRAWGLIPLGLALLILAFSCTAIVQAKEQGVLTTFGKPSDRTLSPGLNTKLPWQKVTKVSTARQTDNFNDGDRETDHRTILVRLGNGNPTRAYGSVTWAPNPEAVDTIFADFRGDDPTDVLYERFVGPAFKASVNTVAGTYNPTAKLAELAASQDSGEIVPADINLAPDLDALAVLVDANFATRVADISGGPDAEPLIVVYSVQLSYIAFDEDTEKKIRQYQDAVQETINSAQAIKTAANRAEANRLLAESISKEPGVLTARCLDLIDSGFQPPPAFSCFGPSTAAPVVPVG